MEKARFVFQRNFVFVLILATFAMSSVVACSSRPCREPRAPELDRTKTASSNSVVEDSEISGSALKDGANSSHPDAVSQSQDSAETRGSTLRVRVYKPDGSRQCAQAKGQSVETMERELAGIRVYSREKRKDGLMHIQVCGSPTGVVNLFEIDSTNLKQAEERGFKRFED